MEVSIPCMEDVCNDKVILLTHFHHFGQNLRKLCSWHGTITDQIVRPKPGNSAKSTLSTCPELHPLCLGFCGLDFPDIILLADFHDPISQPFHPILESIQLNYQDSLSIQWKTCMNGFLDGLNCQFIQHLKRSRNEAIADNG